MPLTPWNLWLCPKCGIGVPNVLDAYKGQPPQLKWDEITKDLTIRCIVCGFSAKVGPTSL